MSTAIDPELEASALAMAMDSALAGLDPGHAAAIRRVLDDDPDAPWARLPTGGRCDVGRLAIDPGDDDDDDGPEGLPRPPAIRLNTPGRRARFRRDLVIWVAHRRGGLSQRLLAEVFGLARSRVAAIVEALDAIDPARRTTP